MKEDEIIERVRSLYPEAVIDAAGEDCSFELFVISDAFEGLNTLQRQKPILAIFKDDIQAGKLHALTIRAKTPQEQSSQNGLIQIEATRP